jgi:type II secretion system protein H
MTNARETRRRRPAFSLVELLLVMAIVTILMAVVAPSLSRSIRGHKLEEEAKRFLALTEYARDEAMSQGVPMVVWINSSTEHFGLDPKVDYYGSKTHRDFALNEDVKFDASTPPTGATVVEIAPNGIPATTSAPSIRLVDHFGSAIVISQRSDGLGYAIPKGS